ncbi:hypothetical protein [uncultured Fibrella sp.]|uniref:hypothetical protein n=1 Tax=uncultured Fibrella sp. TaxID=1284596 RepID=UPI0035CC3C23
MSTIRQTISDAFKGLSPGTIGLHHGDPSTYSHTLSVKTKNSSVKKKKVIQVPGRFYQHGSKTLYLDAKGVWENTALLLSKADALHIAGEIDRFSLSYHGDVKSNNEWLAMYGYNPTMSITFHDKHGKPVQKPMPGMACHNCGIVLPIQLIEIDHHMPQADGEYLYTVKTLRALGLTIAAGTGAKSTGIGNWGKFVIAVKERPFGTNPQLNLVADRNKWIPNDKGKAFLSLCAFAFSLNPFSIGMMALTSACRNSMLNLVPLCRTCNGNKSDYYKVIK